MAWQQTRVFQRRILFQAKERSQRFATCFLSFRLETRLCKRLLFLALFLCIFFRRLGVRQSTLTPLGVSHLTLIPFLIILSQIASNRFVSSVKLSSSKNIVLTLNLLTMYSM